MFDVNPGDITELIESGQFEEGVELEAKRASGNIPSDAWPTISAFANTSGGVLVLGLDETSDGWIPRGMANASQRIQDLLNLMRDTGKISFQAVRNEDVWTEDVNGHRLVILRVHPAPRTSRPVYINGKRDEAYIRNGEGDALCTTVELDRFRREASHQSADRQVFPYLDFSVFDMDTVRHFREESRDRKSGLPHHKLTDEQFLRKVEAWRKTSDTRAEGPTFAGILMFGTEEAIREVRFPHVIDYRRIPTDNTPTRRWTDRERWTGNLYGAWASIFPRLIRGLPTPFRLRGPYRIDEPEGIETLREAFVNLLVHTDYKETRDAVVEHRDDRYVMRNPGDSWVTVENLGIEGRSERRNPVIAQLFDDLGVADQAGSGYLRIYDEWLALGYRKPTVHSDPLRYEFQLDLSLASMLSYQEREWLSSLGGPWHQEEEIALIFARHQGSIDNQTLRSATGQGVLETSRTLTSLRDRGFLRQQGSGSNVSYVLAGTDNGQTAASNGQMAIDDGHLATADSNSERKDELQNIASPIAQTGKASADEVAAMITRLCSIAPLSSPQLAQLLNRSLRTIRRYVRSLISSGLIEPTEDSSRQVEQRYRTVDLYTSTTHGKRDLS